MEETEEHADNISQTTLQRMIGPYVLLRELGRGGAATVYKAMDTRDNSVVALKALAIVPYSDERDQQALLVRMERETRAVEGVSHPNIVRILDVGFAGDSPESLIPYFAMEFLSGETLRARIDRDGALPLEVVVKILDQTASALDAVHASGVVHRDVKPGNLMLMKHNIVKLMDFGIARQDDDATVTRAGMMVGSPAYMSPEQAVGDPATAAADIWGLSVVLYEMVCGKCPFAGPSIPAILYEIRHGAAITLPQTIPGAVADVLLRALNRDAARRYSTATGLAKAFREAVESHTKALAFAPPITQIAPAARPAGDRSKLRARSIHRRLAAAYSVPIVVIAIAVGGTLLARAVRDRAGKSVTRSEEPTHSTSVAAKETVREETSRAAPKPHTESRAPAPAKSALTYRVAPHPSPVATMPTPPIAATVSAIAKTHPVPNQRDVLPSVAVRIPHTSAPGKNTPLADAHPNTAPPQPMPKPDRAPGSPEPAPDADSEPSPGTGSAAVQLALSGIWHGTYASHPALLILNRPSPDDGAFDGTLTVSLSRGAVVLDIRGTVQQNGAFRFREQSVISGASKGDWSLGSARGSVNSTDTIGGAGTGADGRTYGWDFHR